MARSAAIRSDSGARPSASGRPSTPVLSGNLTTFGDSVTQGFNASDAAHRYTNLIAAGTGLTLSNLGITTYEVTETQIAAYINRPLVNNKDRFTIMVGLNDYNHYGTNATSRGYFKGALMANVAWLALPTVNRKTAKDASVAYVGTWADSILYTMCRESYTAGDTATFTISGSVIYIAMGTWSGANSSGTINVNVDGVDKGNFNLFSSDTSLLGNYAHAFLIRIPGLSNTSHTVILTAGVNGGKTTFCWAGGNSGMDLTTSPEVYVGSAYKRINYTGFSGFVNGSDAVADAYNAEISDVVNTLFADGFGVYLADVVKYLIPSTGIHADTLHPNDTGMAMLANAFIDRIYKQYRKPA